MKIAVISDDRKSISMHFGRALYYVVVSVEDGKIVGREVRSKVGHHTFGDHPHEEQPGTPHGYDAASRISTPRWQPTSATARCCWRAE